MSGGVITAAWVQAIPVWVAGIVGLIGLNTWRRQQRGQRQLEHAERALASGRELFSLIRASRSRNIQIPEEDWDDTTKRAKALRDARTERINRAWKSWSAFQGHYALTVFYAGTPSLDVSQETASILTLMKSLSEVICVQELETADKVKAARLVLSLSNRFFGLYKPEDEDEIRDRLAAAEAALMEQLSPILSPPSSWSRLAAAARKMVEST